MVFLVPYGRWKINYPLIGALKGIYMDYKGVVPYFSVKFRALKDRFLAVFRGERGLGRSGRRIGSGCTYPGTYKPPGLQVMAENPPWGNFCFRVQYDQRTKTVHQYRIRGY